MITTKDIYYKIDNQLINQNFWSLEIEEKKNLIEKELKEYIIIKINELSKLPKLPNVLHIIETIEILKKLVPKEQQQEIFSHLIHYVLNVMSTLQGWAIIWHVEETEKLKNKPIIKIDKNGKWDQLVTYENEDYPNIFNHVYDSFQNHFMKGQSKLKIK